MNNALMSSGEESSGGKPNQLERRVWLEQRRQGGAADRRWCLAPVGSRNGGRSGVTVLQRRRLERVIYFLNDLDNDATLRESESDRCDDGNGKGADRKESNKCDDGLTWLTTVSKNLR